MSTLPKLVTSQAIGTARYIDDYVEAGARYVNTGQQRAANTQRAYAGDWRRFTTWCREHGRESLPAGVPTIAAFVTSLAETGKKVATIQRHCAFVSKAHQLAGLRPPMTGNSRRCWKASAARKASSKNKRPRLRWSTLSGSCKALIPSG